MKPVNARATAIDTPVRRLRNLGPVSVRWLESIGVRTRSELHKLGSVAAWARIHDAGFNPTLNMLYALEGALRDEHWGELQESVKRRLRAGVECRQPHSRT